MARNQTKWLVVKNVQYKEGAVYKTKVIGEVWTDIGLSLEQRAEIAKQQGGDRLQAPGTDVPFKDQFRTIP